MSTNQDIQDESDCSIELVDNYTPNDETNKINEQKQQTTIIVEREKFNYEENETTQTIRIKQKDCKFHSSLYHNFRTKIWILPILCAIQLPIFCVSM